jgi:hypothetical protein
LEVLIHLASFFLFPFLNFFNPYHVLYHKKHSSDLGGVAKFFGVVHLSQTKCISVGFNVLLLSDDAFDQSHFQFFFCHLFLAQTN